MTDFGELVDSINNRTRPHNFTDAWLREQLLPTIGRFVGAQVKPLQRRIEELERQIADFQYCGVWRAGVTFKRGNFVTHDGSIFHANCDNCVKPGTDEVAWTLAVKRGKNAPRLPTAMR